MSEPISLWATATQPMSTAVMAARGHRLVAEDAEELFMQALEDGGAEYCGRCEAARYLREEHSCG